MECRRAGPRAGRLVLVVLLLSAALASAWPWSPSPAAADSLPIGDDRLGIDFIAPSAPVSVSRRYDQARAVGARWDRWVIYWRDVEVEPGVFDWSPIDSRVAGDVDHGFSIDAVLLGTPSFYAADRTGAASDGNTGLDAGISPPAGLERPTFADGSDAWAPGKPINPANPWARFVYTAAARYRGRVQVWEVWNEPDADAFWSGSVQEYARLLAVAYRAVRAADPTARVAVGGMMYWEWTNRAGEYAWLKQLIGILQMDPLALANNDYFDILSLHWYSRSADVYRLTIDAERILADAGLGGKEIWINETGIPACDEPSVPLHVSCQDYPGGTNAGSARATGHATTVEQASFIIQAIAGGFAAGAARVFVFQLQDDGNGQAFGLIRNDGTLRPAYQAYQVAARYLAGFTVVQGFSSHGAVGATFGVPGPDPHRTTVLWNTTGQPTTAIVDAAAAAARSVVLIQQDGSQQIVTPGERYAVVLPPATDNRNGDTPWNPSDYLVGGPTVLLVEHLPPDDRPPVSRVSIHPVQGADDRFDISWSGEDPDGWGIADYTIEYRDFSTSGAWITWISTTTSTHATFQGEPGHVYGFRSLARDWAGNVEQKCPDQPDVLVEVAPLFGRSAPSGIAGVLPGLRGLLSGGGC
ncbi:MAG: fibronectin type III domain-containing protein [Chloroflexi bacterium]|nr:fibronectin type III domain-containing protein [Chloroflexota bacterium]